MFARMARPSCLFAACLNCRCKGMQIPRNRWYRYDAVQRGVATLAIKNKVLKRVKDNNYTPDGGQESL